MSPKNQQDNQQGIAAPSETPSQKSDEAESSLDSSKGCRSSVRKRIRVRREDSAFIYNILESHEGITAYSTLPHRQGDLSRDLELYIPPDFLGEVEEVLKRLGDLVYELDEQE